MRSFIAAAILAFGLSSTTAAPLDTTVQGLYRQCKSQAADPLESKFQEALCATYIAGVGDTLQAQGAGGAKIFSICAKPSYGAMVQAFVNWAEANPREWGKNRLFGVIAALSKNWPCH
jgi:Rap1a immunity proteins